MKIKFTKMHGCGNDYIYINCFKYNIENPEKLSVLLSDRHYGIGSDGLILICPSKISDAKMRMFNSDGSEGKMCGNGIRCVGKFLYDNGIVKNKSIKIDTLSGIKSLELVSHSEKVSYLSVDMGRPEFDGRLIPVNFSETNVINKVVNIDNVLYKINCVSMGNPHCIIFFDEIDDLNIDKIHQKFNESSLFPEGINIEYVKILDKNNIKVRVSERGSGETLACGTGACASVVALVKNNMCSINQEINVILKGGTLKIKYTGDTVYMIGEAQKVFEGEIDV